MMRAFLCSEGLVMTRIVDPILIICLSTCVTARAAIYEFRIKGVVTDAYWPEVSVGDRFTLRYTADSRDLNPSSTAGRYAATRAIVTLPNTTIVSSSVGGSPHVQVVPNSPSAVDIVGYRTVGPNYGFGFVLAFPLGTLASDALPLTLSPPTATSAYFSVYDFGPFVTGDITSYASVEVPEPWLLGLLLVFPIMSRVRRNTDPLSGHRCSSRLADRCVALPSGRQEGKWSRKP
jgi:hypothetical protein